MRYTILGADARTGQDKTISLDAPSEQAAEKAARLGGLMVERVIPNVVPAPPVPSPEAGQHPGAATSQPGVSSGARRHILISLALAILLCVGAGTAGVVLVTRWRQEGRPHSDETMAPAQLDKSLPGGVPRVQSASQSPAYTIAVTQTTRNGDVYGSAWIVHGNGGSDLVRGMRVLLLERTIRASAMQSTFEAAKAEYRRLIREYPDLPHDDDDQKISRMDAFLKESPQNIDTLRAYNACKATTPWPRRMQFPIDVCTIKMAKTSVEGKYRLAEITLGDYYLHAIWETGQIYIEWLIPIKVGSDGLQLDLSNDNAITIFD